MNVALLQEARDKARDVAAADPTQAQIEDLRDKIVKAKTRLKRRDLPSTERAQLTQQLSQLESERQSLQTEQRAGVAAAQAALSAARRVDRAAQTESRAADLRSASTAELEERRADLTVRRRALKDELRAVVAVLGERDEEARTAELIATLSDAQKRSLLQRLQVQGVESAEAVGIPGEH